TQDLFRSVLCVLLVRFSSIGDILLTTPLVRALARRHPEAKLVYVTKRAMAPLVADNPHVGEVVALEPDEPLRHLARRLRALAPTHGLDLHGSLRSAGPRRLARRRSPRWGPAPPTPPNVGPSRIGPPWPSGCARPGTGRSSSADPKTAAWRSSSWPGERRRAPRVSSPCRRPGRCCNAPASSCRGT